MPPKKKEKGGKGASAAPKALDEPPQSVPGAPYCISLVLEVCLNAAEPPLADACGDAAQPPVAEVSNGEGVARPGSGQNALLLVDPVFRYTFVNGEKITTPPVGMVGSSWTKVRGDTGSGTTPSAACLEAIEPGGQQEIEDTRRRQPDVWRYTRFHQLQGENDVKVAMALDEKPLMQITLADASLREATVQPPGPGGPRSGGSNTIEAKYGGGGGDVTIPGRNFIDSWPLDLSAFLSGESSIELFIGDTSDSIEGTISDIPNANSAQEEALIGDIAGTGSLPNRVAEKRADAPPAPEGIRHMSVTLSVPRSAAAPAGDATQAPEGDGSRPGTTSSATDGIDTNRKLLSIEAMEELNPMAIRITSASALPGVRVEAESLQHHVKPTAYSLLKTHCKPVYVVCRPFPEHPAGGGALHPRIAWTGGSAQRERARFEHTSAFLLGAMDRHRLEEWIEHSELSIEVHDRDPLPSAKERRENILRLERMVAGGYPVEEGLIDFDEGVEALVKAKDGEEAGDLGEETPSVRYAEPRDIYEVDELALREAIAAAEASGRGNAHGVASFRLSGLLDQSRQLVKAYSTNKRKLSDTMSALGKPVEDEAPRLKLRSEICQRKRREIPKGGVEDWHLSDGERFVRWPGAYLDAGSSLGIRVTVAKPLRTLQEGSAEGTGPATEPGRFFTRAVFVVGYEEGGPLVREVTAAMDKINGRALKGVQGSLRAYRLTPEEKEAVDEGTLNVVCGFMVIDEDSRTIVLEGTAGPRGGLTSLLQKTGRAGPNGRAYRVLENPQVRFSRRLFTCFDADLKKVRLRDPLPVLCQNPEIYDRSKVSAACFEALHRLRMLRQVNRLREAAEQSLFPEASLLMEVESKYGESISVKDITGRSPSKTLRKATQIEGAEPGIPTEEGAVQVEEDAKDGSVGDGGEPRQPSPPARRKAPTDSNNEAFEEWLRQREPRDFLAEQEEVLARSNIDFVERQRRREDELRSETVPTDWCYGPQALNYVELKKAEMRERLAKDKGATYTYSMDYVSQTVSLVDESRLKEDQEAASKAAWKTKRGFVWPCPRTRQELITHPSKPSESRIDTLREPWVENELIGGGDVEATGGGGSGEQGPPELAWRREFDTVPSNGKAVFGGLRRSRYDRSLDADFIGSRSRLPRGRQLLEKDPEFFRSVHLVGEGLQLEKDEAKRRALQLWRSKVVVDDIDFRVGNFNVRDSPLRVDRAKDILHPPINKTAFKMVCNARLPSGKRAPLRPPPISAFSSEPFAEPEDFTVSIRGNHREKWAATDPDTGQKVDFFLRLHRDRMKPKSHIACARLKHPPLKPAETRGPRWETRR